MAVPRPRSVLNSHPLASIASTNSVADTTASKQCEGVPRAYFVDLSKLRRCKQVSVRRGANHISVVLTKSDAVPVSCRDHSVRRAQCRRHTGAHRTARLGSTSGQHVWVSMAERGWVRTVEEARLGCKPSHRLRRSCPHPGRHRRHNPLIPDRQPSAPGRSQHPSLLINAHQHPARAPQPRGVMRWAAHRRDRGCASRQSRQMLQGRAGRGDGSVALDVVSRS